MLERVPQGVPVRTDVAPCRGHGRAGRDRLPRGAAKGGAPAARWEVDVLVAEERQRHDAIGPVRGRRQLHQGARPHQGVLARADTVVPRAADEVEPATRARQLPRPAQYQRPVHISYGILVMAY